MADDLAALQRRFFRLVLAPRGVGEAAPTLFRDDAAALPLRGWIRAPDEAGAVRRLDIYANMYFFRLLDVLRADYPKLTAAIGDDAMHNLATDYLLAHPSDHPSLRQLGRHLPAWLRAHALAAERPPLADLAELEWARIEAFDVADQAVLERADAAALTADAWPSHVFQAVGSARLLRLAHPAHEMWDALENGRPCPPIGACPTDVLVWRGGWQPRHRPVEAGESAALACVLAGRPFSAVCQVVGEGRSEAEAAPLAVAFLLRWIDERLLTL